MGYDAKGALAAGHSPEAVATYLAGKHGYDLKGAVAAGHSHQAILDHLVSKFESGQSTAQPQGMLESAGIGAETTFRGLGRMVGIGDESKLRAMKEQEAQAMEQNPGSTMVGKFGASAATIVPAAFLTPAQPFLAMTVGATRLATMGINTLRALPAGSIIAGGKREETIADLKNRGATDEQAESAANRALPVDAILNATPAGIAAGSATRLGAAAMGAGTGAALNVTAGAASRAAENTALPENLKSPLVDTQSTILEAGLGAVMGAAFKTRIPPKSGAAPNITAEGSAEIIIKHQTDRVKTQEGVIKREQELQTQLSKKIAEIDEISNRFPEEGAKASKVREQLQAKLEESQAKMKTSEATSSEAMLSIAKMEEFLNLDKTKRTVPEEVKNSLPVDKEVDPLAVNRTAPPEELPQTKSLDIKEPVDSTPDARVNAMLHNTDQVAQKTVEVGELPRLELEMHNATDGLNKPYDVIGKTSEDLTKDLYAVAKYIEDRVNSADPIRKEQGEFAKVSILEPIKGELAYRYGQAKTPEQKAHLRQFVDAETAAHVDRIFNKDKVYLRDDTSFDPNLNNVYETTRSARSVLEYIAEDKKSTPLGVIADAILKNKFIAPFLSLVDPQNPKASGAYRSWEGDGKGAIRTTEGAGRGNAGTIIHEMLHAATYRIQSIVDAFNARGRNADPRLEAEYKRLPPEVQRAAQAINLLRNTVIQHYKKNGGQVPPAYEKAFRNNYEFLAYGMTDSQLKLQLLEIPGTGIYKFSNSLKALFDSFTRMLGFSPRQTDVKSALAELFIHTDTLLKHSEGRGISTEEYRYLGLPKKEQYQTVMEKANQHKPNIELRPYAAVRQDALSNPDSGDIPLTRNLSGPQQLAYHIMQYPLTKHVASVINNADRMAQRFLNFYNHGVQDISGRTRVGPFVSLGKVETADSIPHLINKLKAHDWEAIAPLWNKAGINRIDHMVNLKTNGTHLTQVQKDAYIGMAKAVERARYFENNFVLNQRGGYTGNSQIPKFAGYGPTVRKGDFEVIASFQKQVMLSQRTRSKIEAEDLIKRLQSDPSWGKTDITSQPISKLEERLKSASYEDVRRIEVERMEQRVASGTASPQDLVDLRAIHQKEIRKGAPLGGHAKFRSGIPGYEGNKVFQTPREAGLELKQAMMDYGEEMSTHIRRRIISQHTDEIMLDDMLRDRIPNQFKIAKFMADNATGNVQTWMPRVFEGLRSVVDTTAVKAVHAMGYSDWYPKSHVFDRTHGMAAHLFYINALTTNPGFWLAQAFTTFQATRQMFRTDNSIDAMIATGRGFMNVMTGGSQAFRNDMHLEAATQNTFHPQLTNEITSLGFKFAERLGSEKGAKMMRHLGPILSGETIAAAADSFSRYASYAMFWEKYRAMGYKGDKLRMAASADTSATMIMYNSQNKAPIFRQAGLAGDMVSPLMTFSVGQYSNLVADMKYLYHNQNKLAASIPLLITGMTTTLMAGAIGLPFIMEYEALRWFMVNYMPTAISSQAEKMPSILDMLSREEVIKERKIAGMTIPRHAVTYGLPASAVGIDIGSGLRWNQLVSKVVTEGDSPLTLLPAVAYAMNAVDQIVIGLRHEFSDDMIRNAEYRKSMLFLGGHFVGGKGIIDETMFGAGDRDLSIAGKRGYGGREVNALERTATFLGRSTLKGKHDQMVDTVLRAEVKREGEQKQKAIDVMLDSIKDNDPGRMESSINTMLKYDMTSDQVNEQLKAAYNKRGTPMRERFFVDNKGRVRSNTSQRRYMQQERFGDTR